MHGRALLAGAAPVRAAQVGQAGPGADVLDLHVFLGLRGRGGRASHAAQVVPAAAGVHGVSCGRASSA